MPKRYRVELCREGCPNCQSDCTWDIIGPDESAQSQSWGEKEEAEYICDLMNDAYDKGRASFATFVIETLNKETGNAEVEETPTPIEAAPSITTTDYDIPF